LLLLRVETPDEDSLVMQSSLASLSPDERELSLASDIPSTSPAPVVGSDVAGCHVEPEDRFCALYEWTRPRIIAYALRRTSSREDAADIVAETYEVAWRRLEDVPAGSAGRHGVLRRAELSSYPLIRPLVRFCREPAHRFND